MGVILLSIGVAFLLIPPQVPALPLRGTPLLWPSRVEPRMVTARSQAQPLQVTLGPLPQALSPGSTLGVIFPAQGVALHPDDVAVYCSQAFVWFGQTLGVDSTQPSVTLLDPPRGLQLEGGAAWRKWLLLSRYFTSRRDGDLTFSIKEGLCDINQVQLRVGSEGLAAGTSITLEYNGFRSPRTATRVSWMVLVHSPEEPQDRVVWPAPTLVFTGDKTTRLRVIAPSTPPPGEDFELVVQAVDAQGERDPHFVGPVLVGWEENLMASGVITSEDAGQLTLTLRLEEEGLYRLTARTTPQGPLGQSNPILVGAGLHSLLWGDIHRHSVLADGWATPEEVYRRAREEEFLDFMSLSEHNHPDPMERFGQYRRRVELAPEEWSYLTNLADQQDKPGHFTTLHGYEWSSDLGHRNVYFAPGEPFSPLLPFSTPSHLQAPLTPSQFLTAYVGRKVLIIPHHSAFRTFSGRPFDWGEQALGLDRLVEVYSEHGSSESPNSPRPLHGNPLPAPPSRIVRLFTGPELLGPRDAAPPQQGNYLAEVLADGRRFRFIASSDAHFMPDGPLSFPGGLVATWANNNTREAVFEGLWSQRVLATTGARMVIQLSTGEMPPGLVWPWQDLLPGGSPTPLYLSIHGTSPITSVDLNLHMAGDGYQRRTWRGPEQGEWKTHTHTSAGASVVLETELGPMRSGDFAYVRVTQQDGEVGWLGPFWVK